MSRILLEGYYCKGMKNDDKNVTYLTVGIL